MQERGLVITTTMTHSDYRICFFMSLLRLNSGYGVLALTLSALAGLLISTQRNVVNGTMLVISSLIVFVVVVLGCCVWIMVEAERRIHSRLSSKLGVEKIMRFSEECVTREYTSLGDKRTIYYYQIYRAVELRNYICLFYSSTAMTAIRRKDLSAEDWQTLREILRVKCSYTG